MMSDGVKWPLKGVLMITIIYQCTYRVSELARVQHVTVTVEMSSYAQSIVLLLTTKQRAKKKYTDKCNNHKTEGP